MAEKSAGPIPVLVEATEKDLVQWALAMQKQGLPVGRDLMIQKASEICRYIFGFMCSVGLVGHRWCDRFKNRHGEVTIRTEEMSLGRRGTRQSSRGCITSFPGYVRTRMILAACRRKTSER